MAASDHTAAPLQRLLDHVAVRDVVSKVARGTDRMDWELIRTCYWPEAIDDHGPFTGTVEEFIGWLDEALRNFEFSTHYIMNQLVELEGDVAWVESYCLALHRTIAIAENPQQFDWQLNVRYCDKMERRNEEWRIAGRSLAWQGSQLLPVISVAVDADALPDLSTKPIGRVGRRDRSDIAYDRSI